jgi:hypothetical protein
LEHCIQKHTFSVAIIVTTESLLDKWNNVKTIAAQNVQGENKSHCQSLQESKKNKNTCNKWQIEKKQIFRNQLTHIFDISGSTFRHLVNVALMTDYNTLPLTTPKKQNDRIKITIHYFSPEQFKILI